VNQGCRTALAVMLLAAGCKTAAVSRHEPIGAEPSVPGADAGTEPSATALDPGAAILPPPATEADAFSIQCGDSTDFKPQGLLGHAGPGRGQARACRIRGHVRTVHQVDLRPPSRSRGGARDPATRAIELQFTPDAAVPCRTPLDPDDKAPPRTRASHADPEWSGPILVLGGARLAGRLRVGATLCGWARTTTIPGLNGPGWESALLDGSGALLGASSRYFDRAESPLARVFRFSREGPAARQAIDEGGWFVRHRDVRISHGGASALSRDGAEVTLTGPDGTFAVAATSDLTVGPVPVFVGRHDGFDFSAVRVDRDADAGE
jgi:hypothetical protein